MKCSTVVAAVLGLLAGGCDWFDSGRECDEGTYSCDGDKARVCVPKTNEEPGADGVKTTWRVVMTCDDDPVLGPLTCGVTDGQVQCVAEGPDGGAAPSESEQEGEWRRVDVARQGDVYAITDVEAQYLKGAPVAAASGYVAVVSYAGTLPLDAALVQIPETGVSGTVWVRAETATRVAVMDASGEVLDERAIEPARRAKATLAGHVRQALSSSLPPTLRIAEPGEGLELPPAWREQKLRVVNPSSAELDLVGAPLGRLPLAAASGLSLVVFVRDEPDDADDGMADAGVDAGTGPEPQPLSRTELVGTTLWVNVSSAQLAPYEDDEERSAFELELVRRAGEGYVFVASILKPETRSGGAHEAASPAPKLPSDFPPKVADLLTARISPMLAPGEGFLPAWSGLHSIGVEGRIAAAYSEAPTGPKTDKEAVAAGFASALGSQSATLDFAEYLAHASLGDAWRDGPCAAIRGKKVDELPARLLVPIAKLQVLWGLGVLSRENMVACVGELSVASQTNGMVLHKANGEKVTLEDDVQGLRSPYLHGEIHVSGVAQRADVVAVMDMMYRKVLPGVIRIKSVVNGKSDPYGARVALTNNQHFQTSTAKAGLLVVTQVTQQRIEAWGLMLRLTAPMYGASVYPLMTVRLDSPLWQDGDR